MGNGSKQVGVSFIKTGARTCPGSHSAFSIVPHLKSSASESASAGQLKAAVAAVTGVLPALQKYAGCPGLAKAGDDEPLASISGVEAAELNS